MPRPICITELQPDARYILAYREGPSYSSYVGPLLFDRGVAGPIDGWRLRQVAAVWSAVHCYRELADHQLSWGGGEWHYESMRPDPVQPSVTAPVQPLPDPSLIPQLASETDDQYDALQLFAQLEGPQRPQQLARILDVSYQTIYRWAKRHRWSERLKSHGLQEKA